MGGVVVVENVSLDGVVQSPAAADEDVRGGFDRGGWAAEPLARDPEAAGAAMRDQQDVGAMLFGRRTYEHVVGHWLSVSDPNPFTEVLRDTTKYVATRDPDRDLPYPNTRRLDGDLGDAVRGALAETAGDVVVLGSGDVVRQLAAAGLVDRYVLTILPVVLGSGARLFGDTYAPMEVVRSSTSPTGIVTAAYRVLR
jgi:dihydrofolate reductase